MYNMPTHHIQR